MPKTEAIDFSAYKLRDTATLKINDPLGMPLIGPDGEQVAIEVYGPHTERFVQASKLLQHDLDDEEAKRLNHAEHMAHLVADMRHFPYPGGAEAVFKERAFAFIVNQVAARMCQANASGRSSAASRCSAI